MERLEAARAVTAARATASSLGLAADAAVVLHDANRLTVRLVPADVVAQVAPVAHQVAQFELDLAQRLLDAGCPVAAPAPRVEPRVHERDGFAIALWSYHAPVSSAAVPPAGYAEALARLHAGMRQVGVAAPHWTERLDQARRLVASPVETPELVDADRGLLALTLRDLGGVVSGSGGREQLLHGEPHPGNVLRTAGGLLFVDLETCCRGPVEFDLAHAPAGVGECYPGIDLDLLRASRTLVLAINTTWRWERGDQLPDGRRLAEEWLGQIRVAVGR
ncbi:aminoglycoside phosphotransferase [Microlunatus lacustris]